MLTAFVSTMRLAEVTTNSCVFKGLRGRIPMPKRLLLLRLAPLLATPAHAAHLRFMSHKLSRVAARLVLASALENCAAAAAIGTPQQPISSAYTGLTDHLVTIGDRSQLIFWSTTGFLHRLSLLKSRDLTLAAPLAVDTGGPIPAGTTVNSYFFALNLFNCCQNFLANTSATFDGAVLGVIYLENSSGIMSPNFAASDFLGASNTTYQESFCLFCGFERLSGDPAGRQLR